VGLIELKLRSIPSQRSYSRELLEKELERDEGRRNKPYRDTVGKLTIGIGRNLEDKPLSEAAITFLFNEDIEEVEKGLDKHLPWWRELSDARQRVLVNMAFNLGVFGLLGFKNTLAMVKAGNYKGAAAGMLNSKWARQVGQRAFRLSRMMEHG